MVFVCHGSCHMYITGDASTVTTMSLSQTFTYLSVLNYIPNTLEVAVYYYIMRRELPFLCRMSLNTRTFFIWEYSFRVDYIQVIEVPKIVNV